MTQQTANHYFYYKDGILYNKVDRANGKVKAGEVSGCINNTGYMRVEFGGRKHLVHRIIFVMHFGYLPKEVDHEDGNILNNRIDNLREATHFQNMANCKTPITNKSGYKGVCWHKRDQKWRAQINVNNKKIHIGNFSDPVAAHEAYKAAALIHHKEFASV